MTIPQPQSASLWRSYPMGPKLRSYLEIQGDDYTGDQAGEPSAEQMRALTAFLKDYHEKRPALSPEQAVDLVDELVTMALPEAALDLAARYPDLQERDDFRIQLALGVASMLAGDLERAEEALRKAQQALPAEPAPYVNLVQIFLSQGRSDEAELWCLAGIEAERNNHRLWELLARLYHEQLGEYMPERLLQTAESKASWAGLSLAAGLVTTGDRNLKASLLERHYAQGERDPAFLIELTGAYGIAGDFEKIPQIVWQAERLATKGLPWQLHAHCAQAQLALGRGEECLAQVAKAMADRFLPEEARQGLQELEEEAKTVH